MAPSPPESMVELVGSTAVVTGAAQGIGYDVARHLMAAGADVLVFDINAEGATEAARTLAQEHPGRQAVPFAGDVANEDDWRSAFQAPSVKRSSNDSRRHSRRRTDSSRRST